MSTIAWHSILGGKKNMNEKVLRKVMEAPGHAYAGSQLQLQVLSEEFQENIDRGGMIRKKHPDITLLSPVMKDNFQEYKEESLREILGKSLPWENFWPLRGHNLDGLAKDKDTIYIIEAKSHPDESLVPCGAKAPENRVLIERSLEKYVGSKDYINSEHYQLANRLALKGFLEEQGKKAKLIYICFANDMTHMKKHPKWVTSLEEWEMAFEKAKGKDGDLKVAFKF